MTAAAWIGLTLAGALGAPVRYLLDGFVQDRVGGDLPWGTFTVNMVGSLLLGLLTGLSLCGHLGHFGVVVLGTGFCGALTTFSTFTFETTRLAELGDWRGAALNVLGSLGVGLVAASAGLALVAWLG